MLGLATTSALLRRDAPDSTLAPNIHGAGLPAPGAQGRLMNLRIAQAFFHDEWLTEFPSIRSRTRSA